MCKATEKHAFGGFFSHVTHTGERSFVEERLKLFRNGRPTFFTLTKSYHATAEVFVIFFSDLNVASTV